MAVPYTFGSATTSIPLSQLDSNFATTITLGNTAVQLGNTITNLTGVSNLASAGALSLGSNGNTTAITVNTSQNVGVGTTSPNGFSLSIGKLVDIAGTGTGGATPSQLSIYNAATTNTNITARIALGTSGASVNGDGIIFDATNDGTVTTNANQYLTISTRASGVSAERVRVNAFGIGVGGAIPSSGTGITFPATQSASSDANTLDDYEEGTFTPTVSSNTGSITAYTASGYYVKVGRTITITMFIQITTPGTAGGVLNFTALPFTSLNPGFGAGNRSSTSAWREDNNTGNFYFGYMSAGTTSGSITSSTNGAVSWATSAAYVSSFVYETAS